MTVLSDVPNAMNVGIVLLDEDERVAFWNDWMVERSSIASSNAVGQQIAALFPGLAGSRIERAIIDALRLGLSTMLSHNLHPRPFPLYQIQGEASKAIEQSTIIRPVTSASGRYCLVQITDVTAAVARDRRLRDMAGYTRNLIEVSMDPLVTISKSGKITDVNRATEQVTGIPRERLIGTDFSDYFTEPDKADAGYAMAFSQGSVADYPLAIRHVSGRVTDVLYNAVVYRNQEGEIQGVFAAARDITERKRAEDALRESERNFRRIFDQSLIGIAMVSLDHGFMRVNAELCRILGHSEDELLNVGFFAIMHPDDRQASLDLTRKLVQGELDNVNIELRCVRKDGGIVWVHLVIQLMTGPSGESEYLLPLVQDITKRKRAELALISLNRTLATLNRCNEALVRPSTEDQLLREVCEILVEMGGYRLAWVGIVLHDDEKTIRPIASFGCDDGYLGGVRVTWADTERGQGPTGKAVRSGKPFAVQNIAADPGYRVWRPEAAAQGFGSSAAIPMVLEQAVIGVITLYAKETEAFNEDDIDLLMRLGSNVAAGLQARRDAAERKVAEEALRQSEARFRRALNDAPIPIMLHAEDGEVVLLSRVWTELTGYTLADIPTTTVWAERAFGSKMAAIKAEMDKLYGLRFVENAGEYGVETATGDRRLWELRSSPLQPLSDGRRLVITMAVDVTERRKAERELEWLATMDPLTNVPNRGHFVRLAEKEIARAQRYRRPTSILMMDVDHFKRINDTYGHAAGDEALRRVAPACRRTLRDMDILGRVGGEEFALVLPETDETGALCAAERLRLSMAELEVAIPEGSFKLTVSVGVAVFREGETLQHAMSRADKALYQAKHSGRNRVALSRQP